MAGDHNYIYIYTPNFICAPGRIHAYNRNCYTYLYTYLTCMCPQAVPSCTRYIVTALHYFHKKPEMKSEMCRKYLCKPNLFFFLVQVCVVKECNDILFQFRILGIHELDTTPTRLPLLCCVEDVCPFARRLFRAVRERRGSSVKRQACTRG